jgi:hypothetical protein
MKILRTILFLSSVALYSLAIAPPCNWAVFAGGCINDGPCPWYCNTDGTELYQACYTNGSQCCLCYGTIWHCSCLLGEGDWYTLTRAVYADAACITATEPPYCQYINP